MEQMLERVFLPNVFQAEALKALEETNQKGGVVIMPTGTGKTFLSSLWFKRILDLYPNAKLLFVCHNRDILSQANEKEFQNCLRHLDIDFGYYTAKLKEFKQCTFATTQTLTRSLSDFNEDYFDYIIVDEAHHYQAKSFKKVLEYFKPKFALGLTATPYRMDNKNIFDIIGKKIYEAKTCEAIKKGLLCKINYWSVDNDIDFSDVKWNGNNYNEKDLNRVICVKEYDDAILKEYNETLIKKFQKKKTICFCATVEHTHRMAKLFNKNGIKAVGLTGRHRLEKDKTPRGKRKEIIKGFREGDYDIIFVRDLFNEGIDIPSCDSIMMLRPTQSHTIFTQQIGRGLRTAEGKEDVLILDFTGNARRCDINFEVLGEMIEVDIQRKVLSRKNVGKKHIEFINLGNRVRISRTRINVINKNRIEYEKERKKIIAIFNLLRNNSNFKDKCSTMQEFIRCQKDYFKDIKEIKIFKEHSIRKHFGTWVKFMNTMDCELHRNARNRGATKKDLVKEYKRIEKLMKRKPKWSDFCNKNRIANISARVIRSHFKTWNNFLKYMGEYTYADIRSSQYTKERLIKTYNNLKDRLNKKPGVAELEKELKSNMSNFYNLFGVDNWKDLRTKLGDPYTILNKKQIIDEYKRIKKQLGHAPTQKQYIKSLTLKGAGTNPIIREFGGYVNMIRAIGDEKDYTKNRQVSRVLTFKYSNKQLVEMYKDLMKKYNKKYISCKFWSIKTKIAQNAIEKRFGTWNGFIEACGLKPKFHSYPKDILIKKYIDAKKKIGHPPTTKEFKKETGVSHQSLYKHFGGYKDFLTEMGDIDVFLEYLNEIRKDVGFKRRILTVKNIELAGIAYMNGESLSSISRRYKIGISSISKYLKLNDIKMRSLKEQKRASLKRNIKITKTYKPIKEIKKKKAKRSGNPAVYKDMTRKEYKSKEDKIDIREKILSNIRDGDKVLLLESPDLSAIKEIEKQGKKPSKIIIPNNKEFKKLAENIKEYKTDLNIEIINTSVLQYLVDSKEKFDFVWLDYCGAFSYYIEDLDILFSKHFNNMKLILTYNLFDPAKEDDSYYFTKVIDYVLNKVSGKNKIRLINDITYRYKKTMYNIGFEIGELVTT